MSKKTLNEATVRQFMKLVNHKPTTISNFISENYNEEAELEEATDASVNEEEVVAEAEDEDADPVGEPELDAEPAMDADPALDADPAMDAAPEEELSGSEVDITPEMASAIVELGDMLRPLVAGDEELPAEEPMDLEPAPEEPPADLEEPALDDAEEEEPAMMESDEQMVQEVARRVAKRILKAKKAKEDLDKALGNK